MKRTHAYFLSFGLVAAIIVIVYVGWTLSSFELAVTYDKNVDATSKVAAEDYLREHPPKEGQITWTAFWKKAVNPSNREKAPVFVANIDHTDGSSVLYINYPQEDINLTVGDDGSWRKDQPSKGTPMVGRLFQ